MMSLRLRIVKSVIVIINLVTNNQQWCRIGPGHARPRTYRQVLDLLILLQPSIATPAPDAMVSSQLFSSAKTYNSFK